MPFKIAYLCLQATTEGQASHAHVHEIIDGLRDLGHEVDLFEPEYAGGKAPGALGRMREFEKVTKRLEHSLREYDALYVRAHAFTLDAVKAARKRRIPVVVECNGPYDDLFLAWPAARFMKRRLIEMMRWQYTHADRLITVTPELAAWLSADTGRDDVEVIPNGANTGLFTPDAPRRSGLPDRYAVFFGALAPWQGISTCLDAVETEAWPKNVSLVIAGDGMLRGDVESAAEKDRRIVYLGRVPYREIPGVVAGSICSLIPKNAGEHDESGLAPLKLFESMACAVPVVVSRAGGMDRMVAHWGCGMSFPPGDANALARAIAQLATDPDAARIMGNNGRAAVLREASWRIRAQQTARVIETAARRTSRSGGDSRPRRT